MKPLFAEQFVARRWDTDASLIHVDAVQAGIGREILVATHHSNQSSVRRIRRPLKLPFAQQLSRRRIRCRVLDDFQRLTSSAVTQEAERDRTPDRVTKDLQVGRRWTHHWFRKACTRASSRARSHSWNPISRLAMRVARMS